MTKKPGWNFQRQKVLKASQGQQDDDDLPVPDIEGMGIQISKLDTIAIFGLELFANWKKGGQDTEPYFWCLYRAGRKKNQCPEPGKIGIP